MKHLKTPFYPDHTYAIESPELTPIFKSKDEYVAAQTKLVEELLNDFPKLFGKESSPWALGIRDDLIEHLTSKGHSPELVAQTLHFEARSVNYRVNCMLAGVNAERIRFDGQAEGRVSRRDFIYNLMQLSGLVRRKDLKQSWSYKEWALRETVLGFVHGDFTREELIKANLKVKFVELCQGFAKDPKAIDALALKNKRTGELHPTVYGAPYLPDELFNSFKKRNNGHITAGKKKPKRIQLVSHSYKLFLLEGAKKDSGQATKAKVAPSKNKAARGHATSPKRRMPLRQPEDACMELSARKQTSTVTVHVKRKKRAYTLGGGL